MIVKSSDWLTSDKNIALILVCFCSASANGSACQLILLQNVLFDNMSEEYLEWGVYPPPVDDAWLLN